MTRKHYQEAAAIIAAHTAALDGAAHAALVNAFGAFFAKDNPRFDRARFREACKPSPAK